MLEIFRCKRKASNIEPLKLIIGNFYWGVLLDPPQGNYLELTGGVEKLNGGFNPPRPPTIQSLVMRKYRPRPVGHTLFRPSATNRFLNCYGGHTPPII